MTEEIGVPEENPRSQVEIDQVVLMVGGSRGDFPDGHPSNYQLHSTGLIFDEQTGTGVSLWCKPYSSTNI